MYSLLQQFVREPATDRETIEIHVVHKQNPSNVTHIYHPGRAEVTMFFGGSSFYHRSIHYKSIHHGRFITKTVIFAVIVFSISFRIVYDKYDYYQKDVCYCYQENV